MILLAIDTSGPICGVAVLQDGVIRYEAVAANHLTHSESLMPMAEEALRRTELAARDLTLLGVTVGPGSFTGVRIGVSCVKGLAHAMGIQCVAVDALEATALGMGSADEVVCPIQDARVSQVYGAAFRGGRRLTDDCVLKLDAFLETVRPLGERFCFLGDGVKPYREQITASLGGAVRFAPAHQNYLRPAAVALLAEQNRGKAVDYLSLQPLYLRAPQAERERMRRAEAQA